MLDYKKRLNAVLDAQGIKDERREQIMAFAMMESAKERDLDRLKDNTVSANGPLNINESILRLAGVSGTPEELSKKLPTMSLEDGVKYLAAALKNKGLDTVRDCQRDGGSALVSGYGGIDEAFRRNYAFTLQSIQNDPTLMHDDRRVWTTTPYKG